MDKKWSRHARQPSSKWRVAMKFTAFTMSAWLPPMSVAVRHCVKAAWNCQRNIFVITVLACLMRLCASSHCDRPTTPT